MFNEGDWIIRQWKEASGGEIDFAKIKKIVNNSFEHSLFYRFTKTGKIFDLSWENEPISLEKDNRIKYEWRKATEGEIIEHIVIDPIPFNLK